MLVGATLQGFCVNHARFSQEACMLLDRTIYAFYLLFPRIMISDHIKINPNKVQRNESLIFDGV